MVAITFPFKHKRMMESWAIAFVVSVWIIPSSIMPGVTEVPEFGACQFGYIEIVFMPMFLTSILTIST